MDYSSQGARIPGPAIRTRPVWHSRGKSGIRLWHGSLVVISHAKAPALWYQAGASRWCGLDRRQCRTAVRVAVGSGWSQGTEKPGTTGVVLLQTVSMIGWLRRIVRSLRARFRGRAGPPRRLSAWWMVLP